MERLLENYPPDVLKNRFRKKQRIKNGVAESKEPICWLFVCTGGQDCKAQERMAHKDKDR